MPEKEYKTLALEDLVLDEGTGGAGKLAGYASVFNRIDLVGDTVLPGAYTETLPKFVRDGFIAWGHDWDDPVATVDLAREDDRGLWIEASFHSHPEAQRARQIAAERLERGKTMGLSIGYAAKDWKLRSDGVRELIAVDLMETSLVTVPAEPNAQVQSVKGQAADDKGAIRPHTTPKAAEDAAWDAGAEVRQAQGAAQLRRMHAWVDSEGDPEAKGSYKLPHHAASGSVVWRGVAAAMAALQGGRGGVDIPSGDEAGVYAHLARHYAQFDKEPPARTGSSGLVVGVNTFTVGQAGVLTFGGGAQARVPAPGSVPAVSATEAKEGRVLSARNVERLKTNMASLRTVLEELDDLLASAVPGDREAEDGKGQEAVLNPDGLRAWAEWQQTLAARRLR
jgi:HK97 family phage prohead protease